MNATERLDAIEDLKQLKARYFYYIDTKNWDEWAKVFAPDAVMDMSKEFAHTPDPSAYIFHSREKIVELVSGSLGETQTVHHGHTPILSVADDDTATGIWAMEDNFYFPNGNHMLGYGHYHETYRRIDGVWMIAHTYLTRLKTVMIPATPAPANG